MARRPRDLKPEEHQLWQAVAASARPMHPARPQKGERIDPPTHTPRPRKQQPIPEGFAIGERAEPAPLAGVFLAPPPVTPAAPRMDGRLHRDMVRGRLAPEARIDLHGLTLSEAQPELTGFVLRSRERGLRLVLVITGKGKRGEDIGPIPARTGILRHQVPLWLNRPPLAVHVLHVAPAHARHGGEGALYVYLRRSGA